MDDNKSKRRNDILWNRGSGVHCSSQASALAGRATVFLTDDQLQQLTGYTRKHKQIARLRELGIPFIPSAAGFPVVATREVERRLVQDPKIRVKDRPRLELVK